MPYGFMGNAAKNYLTSVSNALSDAHTVHNQNPHGASGGGSPAPPPLPARNNHYVKDSPDSAMSGGYPLGIGNQSNVVVNEEMYAEILQKSRMMDSGIAEEIYNIAAQIEEMCKTVYIVPATLPKFLAIVEKMKSSLDEFQSLVERPGMKAYEFMEEIARYNNQSF